MTTITHKDSCKDTSIRSNEELFDIEFPVRYSSYTHNESTSNYAVASLNDNFTEELRLPVRRTVRLPVRKAPFDSSPSVMLQKYVGVVTKVLEETFFAELVNTANSSERIQVEFEHDDLDVKYQKLLFEGMPLVWAFSKAKINGGTKKVVDLYIRKLRKHSDALVAKNTEGLVSLLSSPTPVND
jgi:hypothetical protein